MTRPGIERRSPEPLANILLIRPVARLLYYVTINWRYKEVHTVPKGINPKNESNCMTGVLTRLLRWRWPGLYPSYNKDFPRVVFILTSNRLRIFWKNIYSTVDNAASQNLKNNLYYAN